MNLSDIEYTLQRLRSVGIFKDKEQEALAAACHIVAELRLVLQYDPRKTNLFNLSDMMRKELSE
jgi:hypothetical protein